MGMSSEVDIEGRDGDIAGVQSHNLEEGVVLGYKADDGRFEDWEMDPIYSLHLSKKHALAEDSSDEIEREREEFSQ